MHAPAFHTSPQHCTEQKMRLLEPNFEASGGDEISAGRVHNYPRSKLLLLRQTRRSTTRGGRVNGKFTRDDPFDGVTGIVPKRIIHIVTGSDGATLYNAKDFAKTVAQLSEGNPSNYVPLTAKYMPDQLSFSLIDLSPQEFVFKQISINGDRLSGKII